MKKSMLVAIAALLLVGTVTAAETSSLSDEANMSRTANTADLFGSKWGFKMTRGLVNAATCWVELPRSIYVETTEDGVLGPCKGLFKGIFLTGVRAVAGTLDVATIGSVDDMYSVYETTSLPYFVWQKWDQVERD
ncbi:exosortase system-associated protein, TIGR04073 family [bacterium]|nr:exosortase system-associated protein, TIGR04073 family [bacterium]